MTDNTSYIESDAEFITPPNNLKNKVGSGGISEEFLQKSQDFIENNSIDFKPYAIKYIDKINGILELSKGTKNEESKKEYLEEISHNIMQLKANGSMFGYQAITKTADTILNFVEQANNINNDLYQIIEGHNSCVSLILNKELKGDDMKQINILTKELNEAIDRYNQKYKN